MKDSTETWIALLRGINVGGNNILPMADLRKLLEGLGYDNVRTYIQSGNCIFGSEQSNRSLIEDTITASIAKAFQFSPSTIALTRAELDSAIANNPFADIYTEPKHVILYFLSAPATAPALDEMESIKADSEQFILTDRIFYLFAPDGTGRSKLAAKVEKLLGVPATARNLNSALKIQAMAQAAQ